MEGLLKVHWQTDEHCDQTIEGDHSKCELVANASSGWKDDQNEAIDGNGCKG